jgi:hypothetical protein
VGGTLAEEPFLCVCVHLAGVLTESDFDLEAAMEQQQRQLTGADGAHPDALAHVRHSSHDRAGRGWPGSWRDEAHSHVSAAAACETQGDMVMVRRV